MTPVQVQDIKIGDVIYNQTGEEVGMVFCADLQDIKIEIVNGRKWRYDAQRIKHRFSLPVDDNLARLLPPFTTCLRVMR